MRARRRSSRAAWARPSARRATARTRRAAAAGSGKTTVALHRVAWLAYDSPLEFRPTQMAVVVAQPQLARYVEKLLPALDCEGVRVFAYSDWVRSAVERLLARGKRSKRDHV